MMLRRMWRRVAAVVLVAALASAGATAATAAQGGGQEARYCSNVDAYRLRSCAVASLPATPLGRQLGWVLDQLAGDARSLTEDEVREHVSAEFLTVVMPPEAVIGAFQGTLAEQGPQHFVGFFYPPREREALAIVENAAGSRGALPVGVTAGRPCSRPSAARTPHRPSCPGAGSRAGSTSAGGGCSCAGPATAAPPWCSRAA